MKEILRDRENALEYEFFHKADEQLWQQLKDQLKCEKLQQALTDATGIIETIGLRLGRNRFHRQRRPCRWMRFRRE